MSDSCCFSLHSAGGKPLHGGDGRQHWPVSCGWSGTDGCCKGGCGVCDGSGWMLDAGRCVGPGGSLYVWSQELRCKEQQWHSAPVCERQNSLPRHEEAVWLQDAGACLRDEAVDDARKCRRCIRLACHCRLGLLDLLHHGGGRWISAWSPQTLLAPM